MIELFIDLLISRAIHVQMFFHYFIVYFCIYLLHEDIKVGKLSLWFALLLLVQVTSANPEYFFHEAVIHEILSIQITLLVLTDKRAKLLVGLSSISIILNILMYEFPREVIFLYENYEMVNRVLLETTMAVLLYDHKSKRRNLILILIMGLIYLHEL